MSSSLELGCVRCVLLFCALSLSLDVYIHTNCMLCKSGMETWWHISRSECDKGIENTAVSMLLVLLLIVAHEYIQAGCLRL